MLQNPAQQIMKWKDFFEQYYKSKILQNVREGKRRVTVELKHIIEYELDLCDSLLDDPEETLSAAEIAITEMDVGVTKLRVRVRGHLPESVIRIRDLRSKHLGKFITIEGTIETKTDVTYKMCSTKFECPSCSNIMNVMQFSDLLVDPQKCSCGRKGNFKIIAKDIKDCFTLRVQELSSSIKYGSEMKMVSVLCDDDLTDTIIEEKLIEGIKVKINGIYKEKYLVKGGKKATQLISFIDANYIHMSDETFYDIELNPEDIEEIKRFSKQPDIIRKIAEGLFQGVHGYYKIKEGLVLQAFGGQSDFKSIPKKRGDIHLLLVGDPGENKSVFLEYACNFNPKSIMVVGKSVSAVGLSGAVIKDELSGSFVLKPGAIPLSNNGLCAIDEIDKMKAEDRDILLEPAEQQSISISKANLPDRKMLARCSFLVSMNPKNNYFNDIDNIYDQIDLAGTLVTRFDLVFIMRKNRLKTDKAVEFEREKARIMMTRGDEDKQKVLLNFHKFMRKYIAYAKQFVHPQFDKFLAEEYLPQKYATFDNEHKPQLGEKVGFPITPRHVGIIRRLAEARRRIMLGDECTVEDIDYAIEKIRGSLEDIAVDVATGRIDQDWVIDGVPTRRKKMIEEFEGAWSTVEEKSGKVMYNDLESELISRGFNSTEIETFISKKKMKGDIFEPRPGLLKKI